LEQSFSSLPFEFAIAKNPLPPGREFFMKFFYEVFLRQVQIIRSDKTIWKILSHNCDRKLSHEETAMPFPPARKILAPFLISILLLVTACGQTQAPSRWDKAQQESTQPAAKAKQTTADKSTAQNQNLPKKAVAGGKLNKYFPASGGGFDRVFAQEKSGFAEAKLNKGGKNVAVLSINDIAGNPSAGAKFQNSTKKISGYPAVNQGANITAVLVANRYQVKVQSRDPSFTASDREAWLSKFNLSGLASVK
jgi:hypothetical protein